MRDDIDLVALVDDLDAYAKRVAARDAAIVASLALQFGTPPETIRHAIVRDERGQAVGPLGTLLDLLAEEEAP